MKVLNGEQQFYCSCYEIYWFCTNLWIFYVILNPNLEIDRYPLPRTEDTFAELQKGELYSKIDLFKAYNQLVLDEQS